MSDRISGHSETGDNSFFYHNHMASACQRYCHGCRSSGWLYLAGAAAGAAPSRSCQAWPSPRRQSWRPSTSPLRVSDCSMARLTFGHVDLRPNGGKVGDAGNVAQLASRVLIRPFCISNRIEPSGIVVSQTIMFSARLAILSSPPPLDAVFARRVRLTGACLIDRFVVIVIEPGQTADPGCVKRGQNADQPRRMRPEQHDVFAMIDDADIRVFWQRYYGLHRRPSTLPCSSPVRTPGT